MQISIQQFSQEIKISILSTAFLDAQLDTESLVLEKLLLNLR